MALRPDVIQYSGNVRGFSPLDTYLRMVNLQSTMRYRDALAEEAELRKREREQQERESKAVREAIEKAQGDWTKLSDILRSSPDVRPSTTASVLEAARKLREEEEKVREKEALGKLWEASGSPEDVLQSLGTVGRYLSPDTFNRLSDALGNYTQKARALAKEKAIGLLGSLYDMGEEELKSVWPSVREALKQYQSVIPIGVPEEPSQRWVQSTLASLGGDNWRKRYEDLLERGRAVAADLAQKLFDAPPEQRKQLWWSMRSNLVATDRSLEHLLPMEIPTDDASLKSFVDSFLPTKDKLAIERQKYEARSARAAAIRDELGLASQLAGAAEPRDMAKTYTGLLQHVVPPEVVREGIVPNPATAEQEPEKAREQIMRMGVPASTQWETEKRAETTGGTAEERKQRELSDALNRIRAQEQTWLFYTSQDPVAIARGDGLYQPRPNAQPISMAERSQSERLAAAVKAYHDSLRAREELIKLLAEKVRLQKSHGLTLAESPEESLANLLDGARQMYEDLRAQVGDKAYLTPPDKALGRAADVLRRAMRESAGEASASGSSQPSGATGAVSAAGAPQAPASQTTGSRRSRFPLDNVKFVLPIGTPLPNTGLLVGQVVLRGGKPYIVVGPGSNPNRVQLVPLEEE